MYRYAEVEAALAKMHHIAPDAIGAFRGRIKHLQKIGVVPSSPGRGKKISYNFGAVAVWAFCLQVAEFGVDPTVTRTFYRAVEGWLLRILLNDREEEDQIMIFIPHLMSRWLIGQWNAEIGLFMVIRPASEATYAHMAAQMPDMHPDARLQRLGMLNISQIRRDLKEALGPSATWVQHGEAYASKSNA